MKKPKLAQTLKSFKKKQVEKAKQERRTANQEAKRKSVEGGHGSGSGAGKQEKSAKKQPVSATQKSEKGGSPDQPTHVPCHIWTDGRYQRRTATPFHPSGESVVLLCGEGDFSYCKALAKLLHDKNPDGAWFIVATALDSEETVKKKYRRAADNLATLSGYGGRVVCLFGVDATKLHENKEIKRLLDERSSNLTRVVFNFPHTGAGIKDRERNIVAQQRLLAGFFASVAKLVDGTDSDKKACTYQTTMVKSHIKLDESGLKRVPSANDAEDEDDLEEESTTFLCPEKFQCHVTLKTGDPYDAWNVKGIAAKATDSRLCCSQSFRFLPGLYAGYKHCRTIGELRNDLESGEIIDADGWGEFLSGKPAKTFVFEVKK